MKQKPSLPGHPPLKLPYLPGAEIPNDKKWRLCEDEQHLRFYYNINTGKTQFANPYQVFIYYFIISICSIYQNNCY